MAQQWYVRLMGTEIGPLSPSAVQEKVRSGQIQPETLVRLGADGKWQPADRIKGLLGKPAGPAANPGAMPLPTAKPTSASVLPHAAIPLGPAAGIPVGSVPGTPKPKHDSDHDRTYHIEGETLDEAALGTEIPDGSGEYDFFRFVGFEQAIGHALFDRLNRHCHDKQLGMTEVTRRALAEYLGCKELVAVQGTPAGASVSEEVKTN